MPETSFVYRASADFGAVDRAINQTERNLERLRAQALTIEAAGGDRTQTNREIAEQRRILRALRDKRQAIQQTADEQEQIADESRQQSRLQRRGTRLYRSLNRSLQQSDQEARGILARSASLHRNLRDAGPAGLAGAGFTALRGVTTGVLGGLGVGAGAAGAIGGGLAAGAGLAALPAIIGLVGTEAAQSFESTEALRRSLDSLGRAQGFDAESQLATFQNRLRGTITDAEALRIVIGVQKLGVPELSADIDEFGVNIANVAAATGEDFDRIFRSIQRFINRGTFERVQDFLPTLSREQVAAAIEGLDEAGAQAARARLAMQALGQQAEATGRQFEDGSQDATNAARRYEVAIEALNQTWGNFARQFVTDIRTDMANAVLYITNLVRVWQGDLTTGQEQTLNALFGLDRGALQERRRLLASGNIQEISRATGIDVLAAQGAGNRRLPERLDPAQLQRYQQALDFVIQVQELDANELRGLIEGGAEAYAEQFSAVTGRFIQTGRRDRGEERAPVFEGDFGIFGNEANLRAFLERRLELLTPQQTLAGQIITQIDREEQIDENALADAITQREFPFLAILNRLPALDQRIPQARTGALDVTGVALDTRGFAERLPTDLLQAQALFEQLDEQLRQREIEAVARGVSTEEFERQNARDLERRNRLERIIQLQARDGAEELSNSIVFMRDTFVGAAGDIIFNARSVEDVLRGLAQSLFDIAAPELFNTVVSGLTRR